jgi:hypothetical protein
MSSRQIPGAGSGLPGFFFLFRFLFPACCGRFIDLFRALFSRRLNLLRKLLTNIYLLRSNLGKGRRILPVFAT